METLPYLALKKIVQQLRPADLARCSAVSRDWHETFNQDWIWKPHCDPELEEPLRTIPSVATPVFVTPVVGNSTLSSIGRWKLAYMRENHLWNNWKSKSILQEGENAIEIENVKNYIFDITFFGDTSIVVLRDHKIEILDVSEKLHVSKAKTDASFTIHEDLYNNAFLRVLGPTMLLVETPLDYWVEVYNVNLTDELISLKRSIFFPGYCDLVYPPYGKRHAKGHLYFLADDQRAVLLVIDLNTGELLQEDPFPMILTENESIEVYEIRGFSTSDCVAITFFIHNIHSIERQVYTKYTLYNIESLAFLPDLVIDVSHWESSDGIALHRHWLAYTVSGSLTVYNVQTKDELMCLKECTYSDLHVWNDCFVFKEIMFASETVENFPEKTSLKKYSPEQRTLTTLIECTYPDDVFIGKFISQKSLIVVCSEDGVQTRYLWKLSGETMMQLKLEDGVDEYGDSRLLYRKTQVNQSLTRAIIPNCLPGNMYVQYLW